MPINFPTSLDNFTNPSSGNTLDSPSHSLQHSDINDAVEAMQRKVGVGSSVAGSASAGQVLTISAAGTSTWSTPTAPGMVLINTTSFNAVGSQSMPASTFTSTYKNYMAILNVSADSNRSLYMQFRSGSTNKATGYYGNGVQMVYTSTTVTGQATNNQTFFYLGEIISAGLESGITMYFYNPAISTTRSLYSSTGANGDYLSVRGGQQIDSEAFDSFTIFPNAGSISGTIRVYGINQ